jgi:hypothetical protein
LGSILRNLTNAMNTSNPTDSTNSINPINSRNYSKRFIFSLIYVSITTKLQYERHMT